MWSSTQGGVGFPTGTCAGVEGPAPASSPVRGQARPKLSQVTSMDLVFLFLHWC